jgi:hypothetical protein
MSPPILALQTQYVDFTGIGELKVRIEQMSVVTGHNEVVGALAVDCGEVSQGLMVYVSIPPIWPGKSGRVFTPIRMVSFR